MPPIELTKISHVNVIIDGYESTLEHFGRVFDAQINLPIPGNPDNPDDTDACLVTIGDVIFEFFCAAPTWRSGSGPTARPIR